MTHASRRVLHRRLSASRGSRAALAAAAVVTSACTSACHRPIWGGPPEGQKAQAQAEMPPTEPAAPEAPEDTAEPADLNPGGHPRILLTRERLDRLSSMAHANDPSWEALLRQCTESAEGKAESGYEGEDWANIALDLALCAKVGGAHGGGAFQAAGVRYLMALVDDKEQVGDKQGGMPVVQENDGYPIRNRGFLAAIAYDWLYDALSAEQRAHVADRFHAFCSWYTKSGYKIDDPIANHYMGYFGACAMGGFALEGDSPFGKEMRAHARQMWRKEIIPAYRKVRGGDFPEGWQYARVPGTALAFYVDTEGRARGPGGAARLAAQLPWLKATVDFQAHALMPDGVHCWDNADWSKKPAHPFAHQLYAVALALPRDDKNLGEASDEALFLARLAKRPDDPNWDWLQAIADDPQRKGVDPRARSTSATSYYARGTETVFGRTDWSKEATWVAINSGPAFGDHQHLDQGHFEIARGADALFIDPGDYDSYATMSHNSLLVDDAHENIRWSPNQGIWGKDPHVARYEDVGGRVYVEASFAGAYNPDGYPEDHAERSVTRAEREFVFSRGGAGSSAHPRVVIYDRVTLSKGSYGVTFAMHPAETPRIEGATTRVTVGGSSATVTTLLPPKATPKVLKEPTTNAEDMFNTNKPAEGVNGIRVEVASPKGERERRFLHVFAIDAAGIAPPQVALITGEGSSGATGAAVDDTAYVFPVAGPQGKGAELNYRAPAGIAHHFVTGLAPKAGYDVAIEAAGDACKITVKPDGKRSASDAGLLTFETGGCAAK